jgi:RNA polymerase sigma-70 factor (ECF subfamily)
MNAVEDAFREHWGGVVATLIRLTGDWDLAEECAQEAFAQALDRWPRDGVPSRPGGWLTTTARNRAIDRLRRRANEMAKLQEVGAMLDLGFRDDDEFGDDRLRLMFTCCHPALPLEAQVALTLRTLAGLSTVEIARAFLVPPATMAARLTRAKKKIHNAAIPYRVPAGHLLPERLAGVLAVIYLLFNEGYTATLRQDLCAEAIRLGRVLVELMPDEPEALGLLALMHLHHARRAARLDVDGELVTLEQQDRSAWDRAEIDAGVRLLEQALRRRRAGPYQIQAAIAACHATAQSSDDTDWPQIAGLYDQLARLAPSPVVELNRAVAIAMADGPLAGLRLLDSLDLPDYHLLPATRADLLRRLGRFDEAFSAYDEALAQTGYTDAERRYLTRRRDEVAVAAGSSGPPGSPAPPPPGR